MGKGYRQGRLGEEIKKVIGELLLREIKDPRLSGLVSISAVEVTPDGSYATAYVTSLGTTLDDEKAEKEKEDVLAALRSAKGLIKREIGRSIKLRHIPELIFKMDTSLEYGRHMSKIISELGIEKYSDDDEESGDDDEQEK
ncbi:30S ribosome-binding factor RbfA [Clostridium aminobutyricum]|uniref:Ribosome-binding factor A n=1 Tax=Clostridium aminobutyricum TaxID=33953 RepID=A0A939D7G2_CLOAM|nr:30S ribosome-binding factor RbfA [Clostridium aminobutyricum]MBN7772143.1 30S ribosome-binding factor RbfA [Clostridium aminobutyricum]